MTSGVVRRINLGGLITFNIVFATGDYVIDMNEIAHHWWADMAWTIAALATALRCFATAQHEKTNVKKAWMLFSCASFSWFLGMIAWDYLELIENQSIPFPGFPDIGFLAFAPFMMAGIIAYYRGTKSASLTVKHLSELALILCAILISLVIILYQSILALNEPFIYLLTTLAYPVLYIGAFFFGLSYPFTHTSSKNPAAFTLLMMGLGIHAFTNTLYASLMLGKNYNIGNYLDIFWVIGFSFIFWSAFEQSAQTSAQKTDAGLPTLRQTKYVEALIPGISIVWLAILFFIFNDAVTPDMTSYILPPAFFMAIFITIISWSNHNIQQSLYADLLASKEALKQVNSNLEKRVEDRTKELEVSKNNALKASDAKSEFLSRMSHELRTPLNAVLGFTQLLNLDNSLSKSQREYTQEIIAAGKHLLCLVNDTLDLQSIEANRVIVNFENIELTPAINKYFALVEHLTKNKNVSLINKIQGNDIRVKADQVKLKQVMINLISNAIKYNHPNGSVTITHKICANGNVRIFITDTGIGIPEAQQNSIFDPFFRLNPYFEEGYGIGLAVTKKLVIAMNGQIGVESTLATGSTFWIELNPGVEKYK